MSTVFYGQEIEEENDNCVKLCWKYGNCNAATLLDGVSKKTCFLHSFVPGIKDSTKYGAYTSENDNWCKLVRATAT